MSLCTVSIAQLRRTGFLMRKFIQSFTVVLALSLLSSSTASAEMMGTNPKPHPSIITSIYMQIVEALTHLFTES